MGDSLIADVNGALQAGLAAAIWVNRDGARPVPTGLRPAAMLSSVLELPSALQQLKLIAPPAPAPPLARAAAAVAAPAPAAAAARHAAEPAPESATQQAEQAEQGDPSLNPG